MSAPQDALDGAPSTEVRRPNPWQRLLVRVAILIVFAALGGLVGALVGGSSRQAMTIGALVGFFVGRAVASALARRSQRTDR